MKPENWVRVGEVFERLAEDKMNPELFLDYQAADEELQSAWIFRFYAGRRRRSFIGATPLEAAEMAWASAYGGASEPK